MKSLITTFPLCVTPVMFSRSCGYTSVNSRRNNNTSRDLNYPAHVCASRGYMIGSGVHICTLYICLWTKHIFESYFRDRLTFSNIRSRTSRRIYRLALSLRAPETLSSLSKNQGFHI